MLGGYRSQRALAGALKLPNFGERTIRDVERDERDMHAHEREAIARLVGISPAFFDVDFGRLAEQDETEAPEEPVETLTPELAQELLRQLLDAAGQVPPRTEEGTG